VLKSTGESTALSDQLLGVIIGSCIGLTCIIASIIIAVCRARYVNDTLDGLFLTAVIMTNFYFYFYYCFLLFFLFLIFLVPQEVKITEVKTKIKPSWNGYVSVSSSAGKVSERGLNWTSESRHWSAGIKTVLRAVHQYAQKSCGPGRPETRQMRRLVARVSQLPLAESHKLLTVPCISDTSCQQLVRRRLLSQWFCSAPRNEGATVRACSVLVSQTSWLLLYRNARCAEGAADTLV